MAIMIPEECDLSRCPMSEQTVFHAVKQNFSNDWIIFHSFDYISRSVNNQLRDCEIDFLIYHPKLGMLILEVKGGIISYHNGKWYQNEEDGISPKSIDPFGQAKNNKYGLMRFLQRSFGKDLPIKFAHAVCFPACHSQENWPAEAEGLVITGDGLPYVEAFATNLLEQTVLPDSLNCVPAISKEAVIQALSPAFEYGKALSERMQIENQQFFRLTEQQSAILQAMTNFKQLLIKGCAGSGKTILAVKKAKQLAENGKQVLLLCFNQLLARKLQKEVKGITNIKAAAFFEYVIELLEIPEKEISQYRSNPKLYSVVLPKMLRDHLYRTCLCYEAVIVDEGQDFSPEAWKVIQLLPEADGWFYVFYDPDQNIFNPGLTLPDFGIPPVELTANCRNTGNIFAALQPYRSAPAILLENTPAGAEVIVREKSSREVLAEELERLVMVEKVQLSDIVVIGGHLQEHTSLGTDPKVGRFTLVNHAAQTGKMEISYYTYMKFKGCEAAVVILYDVDEHDPRWSDKNGIYTAMSRAVHQLIILRKN